MVQSVKDSVYAAAERIRVERRPTVSTVRSAAGVSTSNATRYLKEWPAEKTAAALPALLEQATRLAGACWDDEADTTRVGSGTRYQLGHCAQVGEPSKKRRTGLE